MNEALLNPRQVADWLGVKLDTVYRLKDKPDGLKAYRVGRGVRFRPEDVEEYLTKNMIRPATPKEPFGKGIRRFKYIPGMKVVGI